MKITHTSKNITLHEYNSKTMDVVAKNVDFKFEVHDDRFYFQALGGGVPVNSMEVTIRSAQYNRKLRIDGFYEVRTLPTKDQPFAEAYGHMEAYFIIRGGRVTVRNHEGKDVTYPVSENRFLHLIRKDGKWITYNLEGGVFDPKL
jgi:uncharacterized membrane protein YfhO